MNIRRMVTRLSLTNEDGTTDLSKDELIGRLEAEILQLRSKVVHLEADPKENAVWVSLFKYVCIVLTTVAIGLASNGIMDNMMPLPVPAKEVPTLNIEKLGEQTNSMMTNCLNKSAKDENFKALIDSCTMVVNHFLTVATNEQINQEELMYGIEAQ